MCPRRTKWTPSSRMTATPATYTANTRRHLPPQEDRGRRRARRSSTVASPRMQWSRHAQFWVSSCQRWSRSMMSSQVKSSGPPHRFPVRPQFGMRAVFLVKQNNAMGGPGTIPCSRQGSIRHQARFFSGFLRLSGVRHRQQFMLTTAAFMPAHLLGNVVTSQISA